MLHRKQNVSDISASYFYEIESLTNRRKQSLIEKSRIEYFVLWQYLSRGYTEPRNMAYSFKFPYMISQNFKPWEIDNITIKLIWWSMLSTISSVYKTCFSNIPQEIVAYIKSNKSAANWETRINDVSDIDAEKYFGIT